MAVQSRPSEDRRGFTLIELLVVITIIMVLLSLLIPALSRAEQITDRVLCATNMHQWGVALRAYATDNNNAFPYNGPAVSPWCPVLGQHISWNSSVIQRFWADYLLPNVGASPKDDRHDVLNCPTQKWHQINDYTIDAATGERVSASGGLVGYFYMPGRDPANCDYTPAGNGWVSKTKFGGPDARAPIMSDMKQWHPTLFWFNTPDVPFSSHVRPSGEPEGGNFLFEDARVVWRNSDTTGNPAQNDPDDVIKLGAYITGAGSWQVYYKIPL